MQPVFFFFLLSKVDERQSLEMEGPLVCPLLSSSVYTFSHCEFMPFCRSEPDEEGDWALYLHTLFFMLYNSQGFSTKLRNTDVSFFVFPSQIFNSSLSFWKCTFKTPSREFYFFIQRPTGEAYSSSVDAPYFSLYLISTERQLGILSVALISFPISPCTFLRPHVTCLCSVKRGSESTTWLYYCHSSWNLCFPQIEVQSQMLYRNLL